MLFLSVRGLYDYAGPSSPLAFNAVVRVAFLDQNGVSVLFRDFSKLNSHAH
jgi:hypothetical protein